MVRSLGVVVVLALAAGCDPYSHTVTWSLRIDDVTTSCDDAGIDTVLIRPWFGNADREAEPTPGTESPYRCRDGATVYTDVESGDTRAPVRYTGKAGALQDTVSVSNDAARLTFIGATVTTRWSIEKAGVPVTCADLAASEGWDANRIVFRIQPARTAATCRDTMVRSAALPLLPADLDVTADMQVYIPNADPTTGGHDDTVAIARARVTLTPTGTTALLVFQIP